MTTPFPTPPPERDSKKRIDKAHTETELRRMMDILRQAIGPLEPDLQARFDHNVERFIEGCKPKQSSSQRVNKE